MRLQRYSARMLAVSHRSTLRGHPRTGIGAILLMLGLLLATATACSEGVSAARAPSILFSLSATNATIEMVSDEEGAIAIDKSTAVVWFADRPGRTAGTMTATDLVNGWAVNGFDLDPPNAALLISTAVASTQHVVVLESPEVAGDQIRFHLTVNPDGEEAGFTHVHELVSGKFERIELFIDDAAIPECPTYIAAKAHTVFSCVISPGDGYEKTYQFDQAGLTGTFQLCATQPGLSVYENWGIPQCPGQVTMYTRAPWDGADSYEIGGKPPVIVTATFHGKSKIPKWKPPAGGDSADGAEGGPD